MKDIKTFIIGFLTCACMFLIMGQSNYGNSNYGKSNYSKDNNEVGLYQFHSLGIMILNTRDGAVYQLNEGKWEQMYAPINH